jgi:hypothetical protein
MEEAAMDNIDPASNPEKPAPDTPHVPSASEQPKDPVAKPPKRRRRWPWVLGGVVVLLILLVLLVPTLLSSGAGKSLVVSQVNQRLNGHIEMQNLSLGWASGIRMDGLVVFDATGRQILQLPHFSSGLSLLGAVRGHYNLGKTVVDHCDVLVSREADGSLNWEHLLKSSSKSSASSGEKTSGSSRLPEVSGELVLSDCSATYEDKPHKQLPVYLRAVQGDVKIPGINDPIANTLSTSAQIGSNPPGTISLGGAVSAIKNNHLAIDTANINETVDLKGISVAMLPSVLMSYATPTAAETSGTAGVPPRLDGQSDGHFAIVLNNGNSGSVQAHLGLKDVSLSSGQGPTARQALSGYNATFDTSATYSKTAASTNISVARLDYSDNQNILSLKQGGARNLVITMPALAGNPSGGTIHLAGDLKRLNDISQAFEAAPVVARDPNGEELRSGHLDGDITVAQATPSQVQLTSRLALTNLTVGGKTVTPIQNESVQIALDAVANQDFSELGVNHLDAGGTIFTLQISDTRLKLSNGKAGGAVPLLGRVRQARMQLTIPSLAKLQSLMRSFSPPQSAPTNIALEAPAQKLPGPPIAAATRVPPSGAIPAAPKPALPPASITSGGATLSLNITDAGQTITMTPAMTVTDLGFKKGEVSYNAGTIELKAQAMIMPASAAGASGSMLDEIQELQVSQFHLTAPSVGNADLSLASPIEIKDVGGLMQLLFPKPGAPARPTAASMNGHIVLHGQVEPLLTLNDALAGQAVTQHIGGTYLVDEQMATDAAGVISATGRGEWNDPTIDGQPDAEHAFRMLSELALDGRNKALDIRNLTIAATSTNSLSAVLKGRLLDLGGQQKIENALTADINYDAGPLWKVILPLLSKSTQEKMKDSVAAGKYQKRFEVRGAYPSGMPFGTAVQQLIATGDLQLDEFQGNGVTLKQLALPIDLKAGIATIAYAGKPSGQNIPPAAFFNDGTLSLGGCQIDLRGDHPRLTTPAGHKLVQKATLNPVFAAWSLGSYLNNPLFVGASQATGLLNVTFVQCQGLALDSAITTSDDGTATLDISIQGLHLGNPNWQQIASAVGVRLASLQGNVEHYQVIIDHGITTQDLTLTVGEGKRPLKLSGKVNMATTEMLPVTIDLPWKLFGISAIDKNVQNYLPEGIQIPLRGKLEHPQFSVDLNKLIGDATQKALKDNVLKGILGQKNDNTTQPAGNDPLQQLQDLLKHGKKKK